MGRPTAVSTITMVTRPASGIPAAPIAARGGGNEDHDLVHRRHVNTVSLGNKHHGHRLIQRGAVHIDRGSQGQDELDGPFIHIGFQRTFHRQGQGSRGTGGTECRYQGFGHRSYELTPAPADDNQDGQQDHEMHGQPDDDRQHVFTHSRYFTPEMFSTSGIAQFG